MAKKIDGRRALAVGGTAGPNIAARYKYNYHKVWHNMTRAREEQIIAAAYKEAKARGLPDGWTCTIDVSRLQDQLE